MFTPLMPCCSRCRARADARFVTWSTEPFCVTVRRGVWVVLVYLWGFLKHFMRFAVPPCCTGSLLLFLFLNSFLFFVFFSSPFAVPLWCTSSLLLLHSSPFSPLFLFPSFFFLSFFPSFSSEILFRLHSSPFYLFFIFFIFFAVPCRSRPGRGS